MCGHESKHTYTIYDIVIRSMITSKHRIKHHNLVHSHFIGCKVSMNILWSWIAHKWITCRPKAEPPPLQFAYKDFAHCLAINFKLIVVYCVCLLLYAFLSLQMQLYSSDKRKLSSFPYMHKCSPNTQNLVIVDLICL